MRLFNKLCQNKTTVFLKSGSQRFVSFEPASQGTQAGLNLNFLLFVKERNFKIIVYAEPDNINYPDGKTCQFWF